MLSYRARRAIERRREIEVRAWLELLRRYQYLIGELK